MCGRPSPRARHGAPLRAISAGAKNGAYALIRCSLSRPVSSRACVGSVWAWGGEGAFWARGLGGKLFSSFATHSALCMQHLLVGFAAGTRAACKNYCAGLQHAVVSFATASRGLCNIRSCQLQQQVWPARPPLRPRAPRLGNALRGFRRRILAPEGQGSARAGGRQGGAWERRGPGRDQTRSPVSKAAWPKRRLPPRAPERASAARCQSEIAASTDPRRLFAENWWTWGSLERLRPFMARWSSDFSDAVAFMALPCVYLLRNTSQRRRRSHA